MVISLLFGVCLSVSADSISLDVTVDELAISFWPPDSDPAIFRGSTYIQRYNATCNGIHYSMVFNRTFSSFFSSTSGKNPIDFNKFELLQSIHTESSLINLNSDYLEIEYYIAFDPKMQFKSASLILEPSTTDPGIECDADFYTITIEDVEQPGVDFSGRYNQFAKLKFYYKLSNVYEIFGIQPQINDYQLDLSFENANIDWIFFSDIYYNCDSSKAVLDEIIHSADRICGKLDDVTSILSEATGEAADAISDSIAAQTDQLLNASTDDDPDLSDSIEDSEELFDDYSAVSSELDVYSNTDVSVDIKNLLDDIPANAFLSVNTIVNKIFDYQVFYLFAVFALSIGLITFAIGRRVR